MIGFYNYTVILTYIGTVFGFTGITYTLCGNLKMALICLLGAGLCDMFDGKIASTKKDRTKDEKRFGVQIDSLSDLICFGALPALIGFLYSGTKTWFIPISAAYLLCALIRLAWFNVDEENRQERENTSRETFRGMPVTTSAIIIPACIALAHIFKFSACLHTVVATVLVVGIAIAFITPFPLKKAGALGKTIIALIGVAGLFLVLFGMSSGVNV